MNTREHSSERGQSLVLVALLLIAFAAILALVLDGGNAYAARRQAQNAADAGALAGAQYMCKHQDATGGANKAIEYAVTRNGATSAVANGNLVSDTVAVTATVQQDTFFAGLIGISQTAPQAVAVARCDNPSVGVGALPVAWSCRPNVGGLPGEDCVEKIGPCDNPAEGGNGDGNLGNDLACLYIIMDAKKVDDDIQCDTNPLDGISTGKIDCDVNDDGVNDLMAGGDRSWLDFGKQPKFYIGNPPQETQTVKIHEWWPGQTGNIEAAYKNAKVLVGKNVVVPVFNKFCSNGKDLIYVGGTETLDACSVTKPPDVVIKAGNGKAFYHIASFAVFHITCVAEKDQDGCYGHNYLSDPARKIIKSNESTIEGYFVEINLPGYSGGNGSVDAGAFVVNLVK